MKLKPFNFNHHYGLVSDYFDDPFALSVLKQRQKKADDDIKSMTDGLIESNELCSIQEVKNVLFAKGIGENHLNYSKTVFCEHLNITIQGDM